MLLPAMFRPSRSTAKSPSSTRLRCSVHSTTQEMPTTWGFGSRINLHKLTLGDKYIRVCTHLYFVRVLIKPFLYTMCVQDCPARPMILRPVSVSHRIIHSKKKKCIPSHRALLACPRRDPQHRPRHLSLRQRILCTI